MTDTTELLHPLADAEVALNAAKAAIRKSTKAIAAVRSAHRRAEIAEAELAALRGGIREWGANPTNLQNMYAQLASRTRQWRETKTELAAVQATVARVRELAEAATRYDDVPQDHLARGILATLDGPAGSTSTDGDPS